ncbi:MAG: hypothetical protein R2873_08025 [Caldilineaceae bacterium]
MYVSRKWYRIVSILVCLSLLGQTLGIAAFAPQPAAAAMLPAPQPREDVASALPAPLADPLTISRVQSRYKTGGAVEITYALHNNLAPTRAPETTAGAPVTDTVAILTAFDPADDMNALRSVVVSTTLASGASFVDSTGAPAQSGDTLSWSLPAILPGTSYTFTMTVQPPGVAADFTLLEDGLTAAATLWDTTVNASARATRARRRPRRDGAGERRGRSHRRRHALVQQQIRPGPPVRV